MEKGHCEVGKGLEMGGRKEESSPVCLFFFFFFFSFWYLVLGQLGEEGEREIEMDRL